MHRLRCALLILVAFWLPIQAAYAVTMPFCRHATMQSAQGEEAHASVAHCHEHAVEMADAPRDIPPLADSACDNCEMCHLATAGYLPVTFAALPLIAASILVATPLSVTSSHIPEPPQHPPRRLN